jgi:hypothetical protein
VIKGRCNILEIPVDDAVVGQVLHNGQDGTTDKTKRISLSSPSPGEEQRNVPKHCYGISFREVAALTEALKKLAPDSKLESEVVSCPRVEPLFIEFDLQKDNQTF